MEIKGNEIARMFLGKTERHGEVVNVCYVVTVDGYPMEYVEGEHDQELIRLTREFAEGNDALLANGHVDFATLRNKGLYDVVGEKFQVDRQAFEQAERYYREKANEEILVHDLTYGIANQYYQDMVNTNKTWWLSPSGLELANATRERKSFESPYYGSGATYLAAVSKMAEYKKEDPDKFLSIDRACDELVEKSDTLKDQIDTWYQKKDTVEVFKRNLLFGDVMTIFEKREETKEEPEKKTAFQNWMSQHCPNVMYCKTNLLPILKEKCSFVKESIPLAAKRVTTAIQKPVDKVKDIKEKVTNLAYSGPPKFNWWEEHKLERERKYVIKRDKKKKFHKAWDGTIHKLKVGASIVAITALLGYCSANHANAMAASSKEGNDRKPSSSSSQQPDGRKIKMGTLIEFAKSKEYQEILVNRVMETLEQGAALMAQSTQGHVK